MRERLRRVLLVDGSAPARAAALVSLAAALALVVAGSLLLFAVRAGLAGHAESVARSRAEAVARDVADGRMPLTGLIPLGDGNLVQVTTADGRVLTASDNLAGHGPVAAYAPRADRRSATVTVDVPFSAPEPLTGDIAHTEPFRIVAIRTESPAGPMIAYAGASMTPVRTASHALLWVMLPGLPILVAAIAYATHRQTAKALRKRTG